MLNKKKSWNNFQVGKAASKIQSCFKARMARKCPKEAPKESPPPPAAKEEAAEKAKAAEEEIDIDLEDPEVNEAAKKMQACFKARKKTVWRTNVSTVRLGYLVVLEQ